MKDTAAAYGSAGAEQCSGITDGLPVPAFATEKLLAQGGVVANLLETPYLGERAVIGTFSDVMK